VPHEATLIATIVGALVSACAFGLLANRLRLPPLVGYLVAGIAIGPFTPGFVADTGLAQQLAEIGVILLMFGVGLHFSVHDLLDVRRVAVPGALAQMAVAIAAGVGLGLAWGWSSLAGVLLGLALSVASTVVLLRVLEDRRALDATDGRIAVGWLIVQDLAMVLALVLLPALARPPGTGPLPLGGLAAELAWTIAEVALFAILVVVVGTRVVPRVLAFVARAGSRELFTLAVLATALGLAFGSAELFGVSFALGAFFAGVVLSESDLSHQAAADSLPLRDAFAVLFFVSVGMLFDPTILLREPLGVAAVLFVILVAKSLAAVAVVLASGLPLASALRVAAGLAQIGEFSFILAGLGTALGVLPPEGRDLILAGALLSITLNSLAFDAVDPLSRWLETRPGFVARLRRSTRPAPDTYPRPETPASRDHAVIVGYGRVGGTIGRALRQLELPFVAVERDRRRAEELRRRGLAVVWGDAAAPGVLEATHVRHARLLVVAVPDSLQARRIIDCAREANPGIEMVVRAHSEAELPRLQSQGVGLAVVGEREIALAMLDYTLRGLDFREAEARLVVQAFRASGDATMRPGDDGPPRRPVPELRRHRAQEEADDAGASGGRGRSVEGALGQR
jgi:monovalent cation:H+ antiporter-2, CPA2 family